MSELYNNRILMPAPCIKYDYEYGRYKNATWNYYSGQKKYNGNPQGLARVIFESGAIYEGRIDDK